MNVSNALLDPANNWDSRFTIDLIEQGYADKLKTFCDKRDELSRSNRNLWTIVGEWTTASTDCEQVSLWSRYSMAFVFDEILWTGK